MNPTPNPIDTVVADLQQRRSTSTPGSGWPSSAGYPGVRKPRDAFRGMRYATVTDPDGNGNGIDLYRPLPERPTAE